VIALDVADLVVIGARTLGISHDAALSQIDIAAAQAALTEARPASSVIIGQDTAAAAGIGLIHALLRHRPFPRHGEQIAVTAGLQLLSLNGWRADLDPPAAAAVVVESLACGQLSPVSAAAWLSPRLAAVPELAAAKKLAAGPKPPSVRYPQVLLFVQAACWALGTVGGLLLSATSLAHGSAGVTAAAVTLGWSAIAGGLLAAKLRLGMLVGRNPARRTRRAVIFTELAMTGFGVLWLAIPAYGFNLLGFAGAVLSLAAVLCLMRPRARQYFTGQETVPGTPGRAARPGPARFRPLVPAARRLAVL
jgi:hypothetical protein